MLVDRLSQPDLLGTYCRAYQHVSDEHYDRRSTGAVGFLLRIVDREAAADTCRRPGEQRRDEVGELVPREAAGFIGDVRQALRRELDGIEHVEVDVQPPPVHVTRQLLDRPASGAGRIV